MNFTAGGWPQDIKGSDAVDKQRYIRRLTLESMYHSSVMQLTQVMQHLIQSQNTINLYEQYYTNTAAGEHAAPNNWSGSEASSNPMQQEQLATRTVAVFRDSASSGLASKRSATSITWYPDSSATKLAVSYSSLEFQKELQGKAEAQSGSSSGSGQAPPATPAAAATATAAATGTVPTQPTSSSAAPAASEYTSYTWDLQHPNLPDTTIVPSTSPLTVLLYNPRSPDHLLAGSYNGTISFYDLRKSNTAIECSTLEVSHSDPIYSLAWIQSRTGNECCSISTDGLMLWWDIRKLKAGPIDKFVLRMDDNDKIKMEQPLIYGALSLEYKSDAGATRYLIGTEQGVILLVDRKAKKDSESTKVIKTIYGSAATSTTGFGHSGPVYALQRHPFHSKYFLSVGDFTCKIWFEDLKSPLLSTPAHNTYLTTGCWSPTRAGVFFTAALDGTISVWDLFAKIGEPVYVTKVTGADTRITSLSVKGDGRNLAIGTADGSVTVLALSASLYEAQRDEKQVIGALLERETKRERNLELRLIQRKRENKDDSSNAAASRGLQSPTNATRQSAQFSRGTMQQSMAISLQPPTDLLPIDTDSELKALLQQAEESFYAAVADKQDTGAGEVAAVSAEKEEPEEKQQLQEGGDN